MGEVRVVGIRVEQPANQPVLLLRESEGDRYLPIWIGQTEANAIILGICQQRQAKLMVKGKSMVSEEIELNHAAEAAGLLK